MTPLHRHWPHWLECCKSRGGKRARSRGEGGRRRSMKCNYFNYPRKPRRQLFPIWISLPRICDNLLLFCFPSKSSPYWSLSFSALHFDWRTFYKIDYFLWYNDIMAEFLLTSFFVNSSVSIWSSSRFFLQRRFEEQVTTNGSQVTSPKLRSAHNLDRDPR